MILHIFAIFLVWHSLGHQWMIRFPLRRPINPPPGLGPRHFLLVWRACPKFLSEFFSRIFGLVSTGLQAPQEMHTQNLRPELSAFLSNFTLLNPHFFTPNFCLQRTKRHDVNDFDSGLVVAAKWLAGNVFVLSCVCFSPTTPWFCKTVVRDSR